MTRKPFVLGLTGSVGMGKSAVAALLRERGIPVLDSDAVVHAALGPGGAAVKRVARLFPGVLKKDTIDRAALGREVFGAPEKRKRLEAILHPMVWKAQRDFIQQARQRGDAMVVFEIPLLFETGAEKRCDAVVCVTAPADVQKRRVLARPGMTWVRFRAIAKAQMPDQEKRRRADYVIDNGGTRAATRRQVAALLKEPGIVAGKARKHA